jgi:hypothetical protein
MDYLGCGLHFDVVADGDLVIKHPSPSWRIGARLMARRPGLALRPGDLVRAVQSLESQRHDLMAAVASRPLPKALTAHTRVYEDVILQSRVTPLADAIAAADDPFSLVEAYIDTVLAGWGHGLADASYRMLTNHGLDDDGRVVITGVADLTFDRRIVAHGVARTVWEDVRETRRMPSGLRRYYMERMAERLTSERLDAEWNVGSRRAPRRPARRGDRPGAAPARTASARLRIPIS